jgi:hypothetical protein
MTKSLGLYHYVGYCPLPEVYLIHMTFRQFALFSSSDYILTAAFSVQVEVFWVVTPCSVVTGYAEDGCSMDL